MWPQADKLLTKPYWYLMTSSEKINENSLNQKEQKSNSQKSKNVSPNAGMMGANAILASAKIDEDADPTAYTPKPDEGRFIIKVCGCQIMLPYQ